MKKMKNDPDMLEEYDFTGGVRGKYAKRYEEGANVVVIDPDVAKYFPDHDSVNEALRSLAKIIKRQWEAQQAAEECNAGIVCYIQAIRPSNRHLSLGQSRHCPHGRIYSEEVWDYLSAGVSSRISNQFFLFQG